MTLPRQDWITRMIERGASGLRRSPLNNLSEEEITFIFSEAQSIGINIDILRPNEGDSTGYSDDMDVIFIRGDIYPDMDGTHPRDIMNVRAVLAHEYYGHRANRGTHWDIGDWRDEFRASYQAAKNTPNLTIQERIQLLNDARARASEAGVSIKHNKYMLEVLYGR